jgi:uncharacterized protein (TIGR04141 family)
MPAKQTKPLEYVSLYLLKVEAKKPESALAAGKFAKKIVADTAVLPGGQLHYLAPPPNPVGWRSFLLPGFGSNLPDFKSKHVSAVLFFPRNGRIFAATFGYGRSLLAEGKLEPDFGLRTALQLCDPDTLNAVDYRTIEERTRIGRVQLSDRASVDAFRMDLDTDLLRGMEARSRDPKVCERIAARWASLTVGARVTIKDLPALAAALLKAYKTKKLPRQFAWIDNVQRTTDPSTLAALDGELEARLDGNNHTGIRLAIPEIIADSADLDAKLFQPTGNDFDSSVQTYLDARERKVSSTLLAAKNSHKIVLVDPSSGQQRAAFPVYRCLVAEVTYQGQLYLLADGEWFSLNEDFVKQTNRAVNRIPILKHKLPAWIPNEREDKWNLRACKQWTDAVCLDKANIPYGGSQSKIEPADFLTRSRILAHVKRRDKNSSGLSHMFSQGAVSAQLIRQERTFRKTLAAKLPSSHSAAAAELRRVTFDPTRWTVAYVVLGADATKPAQDLPFFSKVNLMKHADRLRLMDFRVGIIGI